MVITTLKIDMDMHEISRQRLIEALITTRNITNGLLIFKGNSEVYKNETDTELPFRQDSWFHYLFGVKEPGFYGIINLNDKNATLFIPKLDPEYEIWCGRIIAPDEFKEIYQVSEVLYTHELENYLLSFFEKYPLDKCYTLNGTNSDSGNAIPSFVFPFDQVSISSFLDTSEQLYETLSSLRVIKLEKEVKLMRYCAYVASNAHVSVMRNAKPNMMEYELEAWFLFEIYKMGGCRFTPYTCICACGPNSSILHYGHAGFPNSRQIQNGEMALLDMGAEYHGYASDITCSFPISGRFSRDQRVLYEGVVYAQKAVITMMKPGVSWSDCHKIAEKEIIKALLRLGILRGDLEAIITAQIGAIFFPHGLGHLIGCDTHDVGGYLPGCPPRSTLPGLVKLRTSRVLEPGMMITVEPGCYFIKPLINQALNNPAQNIFINESRLQEFYSFGGVRLEDVVQVTDISARNLTTCPRTVEEVEGVMDGTLSWPPLIDDAPELKRAWGFLAGNGEDIFDVALSM